MYVTLLYLSNILPLSSSNLFVYLNFLYDFFFFQIVFRRAGVLEGKGVIRNTRYEILPHRFTPASPLRRFICVLSFRRACYYCYALLRLGLYTEQTLKGVSTGWNASRSIWKRYYWIYVLLKLKYLRGMLLRTVYFNVQCARRKAPRPLSEGNDLISRAAQANDWHFRHL